MRSTVALTAAAFLVACAGEPPPPLPTIDTQAMSDTVSAQVSDAHENLAAQPADADANGRLAMLFDTYGKPAEAAALYARARHYAPQTFRWHYLHARALAELGETEEAIAAYEQALGLRPGYPAAELALAQLAFDSGDLERAANLYDELLARNPSYAQAYVGRARVALERGEPATAIGLLRNALSINGKYGQAHYVLSQAYRLAGDEALAATHLKLFERYRLIEPGRNDPVLREVELLDVAEQTRPQRGVELLGRGRFSEAAQVFTSLAADFPDAAGPHHNLIAAYTELGQWELAERHAEIAAELDPDAVQLYDNLGILLLRQQRLEEAEAAFRRAAELDPDYSVPYRNLAAVLTARGRDEEAIEAYRRALALEPTDRQSRFLLGRLLVKRARAAEAVEVLAPLVEVTLADTPLHLQLLGNAQIDAGRPGEAIATLQRAQALAQVRGLEGAANDIGTAIARARRLQQR